MQPIPQTLRNRPLALAGACLTLVAPVVAALGLAGCAARPASPPSPAAEASASSSAAERLRETLRALSFRAGISGLGIAAEGTVPPGYGAGVKLYAVTPNGGELPTDRTLFPFPQGSAGAEPDDALTFTHPRLLPPSPSDEENANATNSSGIASPDLPHGK